MSASLPAILFAENSPYDVEMTLAALEENHIANEIVVVPDDAVAIAGK